VFSAHTGGQPRYVVFDGLRGRRARIGLLRGTPGLGDLLCAVPSWRALRAAVPDAHVTLVAQPLAASVVARLPGYVDEHLLFPGFPGLPDAGQDVRETVRFLAAAQERQFDLVVQQHGDGRVTNVLACLLGGRRTAGFHGPHSLRPDPDTFLPYPDSEHEVRRHLRLMAHLGARACGEHLELELLPQDRKAADAIATDIGPYAVLHPGAADPARRWPAHAFVEVGRALAGRGLGVLVTGGAAEVALADGIADAVGGAARSVAGRTDLGVLAALIDGASLVVCNDTGPSHLAVARGVRSVVTVPGAPDRAWLPLDGVRHRVVTGDGATPSVGSVVAAVEHQLTAT
jgi:ADP-heptose:LPS heptosyltransferase